MTKRGFFIAALLSAALVATSFISIQAAFAHEVGCDGKPPDATIKASCCGNHDWLRLQPGQWRQDGSVYFVIIDGKWEPVLDGHSDTPIQPLPSTDGCDYVWFRRQGENGYWNDDESAHTGLGVIHFFCLQLVMGF